MSLRSRFRQFGSQCPSRTPRVAVLSNPTCAPFPHRVHAPGCRAYPSLSCAPSLSKADRAGLLSQYTIPQSGWVSEGHSPGTSFQEVRVAMEIRQQRPAEAVPCFRLVPLHHHSMQRFPPASRFSFLPFLAWHSLGLKPCARRLGPLCFAQLQRALRVSAPPTTFPICRKTGSRKSCRSPRKSTPPVLGAAASRFPGAQAKTGRKGVTDACISIA